MKIIINFIVTTVRNLLSHLVEQVVMSKPRGLRDDRRSDMHIYIDPVALDATLTLPTRSVGRS